MNALLLEDHPLFRFGVRALLLQHWPTAHVQEADTLAQALEAVRLATFDIAILDLNLPDAGGLESVTQLRRAAPTTRLLVLSLNQEAAYAQRALQLGACAYLTKAHAAQELVVAIERVLAGGRYITASLGELLAGQWADGASAEGPAHSLLGAQEYRVLLMLAAGLRVGEIGKRMHLSPKTVSTYRTRVLQKLALGNNIDIAQYCRHHQLVLPD